MKINSTFFKIWLPLFILFISTGNFKAQSQNVIIVNNAVGFPDSTVVIDVDIQNNDPYLGFQFDVSLPEGFSFMDNSVIINPPNFIVSAGVLPNSTTLSIQGFSLNPPVFEWVNISFTLNTPSQSGTFPLNLLSAFLETMDGIIVHLSINNGTITLIEGPVLLPGDANCDGTVNVQDVVAIVSYILGANPQPFCFDNADVNEDGQINVNDVVGTVNIILGGF